MHWKEEIQMISDLKHDAAVPVMRGIFFATAPSACS